MLTRKELSDALGISRQSLNQWEHDGANIEEVLALPLDEAVGWLKLWREDNRRPRFQKEGIEPNGNGSLQERLLAAQISKTREEAEAKAIKNAERRRELLDAEEVELGMSELTGMVRSELEAMPEKAIQSLPAEVKGTVLEALQNEIHLLLTRMSQWRLSE